MFEKLDYCPICNSTKFANYMICEDFTVSSEKFAIVQCKQCSFLFTNPRPTKESLPQYYNSKDYISHSNQSSNPINLIYKIARRFTLKSKLSLINKLSKKGTILDLGCGTGHFLSICKKNGWHVYGVEPDTQARNLASKIVGKPIFENLLNDLKPNSIDIITLWHVLEHIPDLNQYLKTIHHLLKPKGKLIIAVPNHKSYDAIFYKEYWAAYDLPRHLYHFEKSTMIKLLKKHALKLDNILPMKLDAFYVSLLSEKNKSTGLKIYPNAMINGLKSNNYATNNNDNFSSLTYIFHK